MKKIFTMIVLCGSFWASAQEVKLSTAGIINGSSKVDNVAKWFNVGDTVKIRITLTGTPEVYNSGTITIREGIRLVSSVVMNYVDMKTTDKPNVFIYQWIAEYGKFGAMTLYVNGSNIQTFGINTPTGIEDNLLMKKDVKPIAIYDMQGRKEIGRAHV